METIRFENGSPQLLELHQYRIAKTQRQYHGAAIITDLLEALTIPTFVKKGKYKCRVIYGKNIEKVTFEPYQIKKIKSLQLIEATDLRYYYKYADRSALTALYNRKGNADDILIHQAGRIKDTSYANVLFYDGSAWWTPRYPLLQGVQRAFLLEQKKVKTADIRLEDLRNFEKIRLVNAMLTFEDAEEIAVRKIIG